MGKSFWGFVVKAGATGAAASATNKAKWLKPLANKIQQRGEYQLLSENDKRIVDEKRERAAFNRKQKVSTAKEYLAKKKRYRAIEKSISMTRWPF